MGKKALLMILDGWGIGNGSSSDVISQMETPYWDYLNKTYPHSQLAASGEDVGLPEGQMGNSEVGHLNIGAGRVVYQDLVKINRAINDGSIYKNPEIERAFGTAKERGVKIHFMGLLSDGGVHSSMDHLFALCDIAKSYGIKDHYVHCFMDGRDTDPRSGLGFVRELQNKLSETGGNIATIVGRYYAMDRDKRWERVAVAYNAMVKGEGELSVDLAKAVEASYGNGVTDEFIKPIVHANVSGKPMAEIAAGDVVIFFNYRNDRAKELTMVLTQEDMPEFGMKVLPLDYYCMTPYDSSFKGVHIIFDKENVSETLGEVVAKAGKRQLRIAETEKYAHVTFFFSGGRENEFELEDRVLIPSPKVATYDLQPEMSAHEVADALVKELDKKEFDLVVVNFANGDMVGHTGVYTAIEKAVTTIDECVKQVIESAKINGYEAIIIADHGNADNAVNADGSANTAHSLNPVPFVYVTENKGAHVKDGILADVAPSILRIMGIDKPISMSGESLIDR